MRPVRLTMSAFGPYAGREVVDFRAAMDAGLFGIYGQTGSGKSTIFSAMTFALFGEAARAEQDAASLRSGHADPELPTEVEFVFDLGARRYVVRRRPEQARPKKRGAGETMEAHEAFLFDATGLSPEEIAAGRTGKVLAEKKVGLVAEAIRALLGYEVAQFRQIVLLPQGRFEAFLVAKTEARLAILRELFDVSLYRRLTETLKADAAEAERQVRAERDACARRLKGEGFETSQALAQGILEAEARLAGARQEEMAADEAVKAARAAQDAARRTEELFRAAEQAQADLAAKRARASEMTALAACVAKAEHARALLDVERQWRACAKEARAAETEARAAAERAGRAIRESEAAALQLATEQARADELTDLRRAVMQLEQHEETFAQTRGLAEEAAAAADALEAHRRAAQAAEEECAELAERRRLGEEALERARAIESSRDGIIAEGLELKLALRGAEAFEDAARQVVDARAEEQRALSLLDGALRDAEAARAALDAAEAAHAAAVAVHLAARLVAGAPCPVCGSPHHPVPASGEAEGRGLAAALRTAKAAWEKAEAVKQRHEQARAACGATRTEREARLAALDPPPQPAAVVSEALDGLRGRLAALGPKTDLAAAAARLAQLAGSLAEAEKRRDVARQAAMQAETAEAAARSRLAQSLSAIPESLRLPGALSAMLKDRQRLLAEREHSLRVVDETARAAREAMLAAGKDAEAAEAARTAVQGRLAAARALFEERLLHSGLTEAEFGASLPAIETLDRDRDALAAHERALALAEAVAEQARLAIEGVLRPDPVPFAQALEEAEDGLRQATDRRAREVARRDQLLTLRLELAETFTRLEDLEAETAPLRELAAQFAGRNAHNLDLETFAIGAMFDHVLEAANHRLGPMTGGRYSLERESEGGGRARRGLGIRVFDLYTGKARATATLSGGETFIAALALALGLSDVVEAVSGKVRLDTIFIDEGFGSLDMESASGTLDLVLQVLTELAGERRAVGLISHVPRVQEAIPRGFYVRKGAAGSTIETRTEG